ncbi:MAG: ankyrin repeat domain-containing protein [Bdellovibrionales bacterium]|nr:ankyrin repeat domain-containing protein [Bdellovibrionales bacterium]
MNSKKKHQGNDPAVELACQIAKRRAALQRRDDLADHLINACRTGSLPLVRTLVAARADPNSSRVLGTPLGEAISSRASVVLIEFLLGVGANPNLLDQNGYSPLFLAADIDYSAATLLLLSQGAEANAQHPENGWTPLMAAAASGSVFSLIELLGHGAITELRSFDGLTALDLAKANKQLTCARALLIHKKLVKLR